MPLGFTRASGLSWFFLQDYINKKRRLFPRFYFLSNDDLLKIVSCAKQPALLQTSFQKVFSGVASVALSKADAQLIEGLVSAEEERVALVSTVHASAPVEAWFAALESSMVETLRRRLVTAVNSRPREVSALSDWAVGPLPVQCVLTACALQWTEGVECALSSLQEGGFSDALNDCLNEVNAQIAE